MPGAGGIRQDIYAFDLAARSTRPAADLAGRSEGATPCGRLQDSSYAGLVEPFSAERYNKNLSVAENLLFGTPVGLTLRRHNRRRSLHSRSSEPGLTRICIWASQSSRLWSSSSPACRPTTCSGNTAHLRRRAAQCPPAAATGQQGRQAAAAGRQ